MNAVIQDDDHTDTDHDHPSISLEAVRAAIAAGITPKWWSYSVYPNGTINVTDALSAFAQRVDAFADIVVEDSDDEAVQGVGRALGELAAEAIALVGIARESKTAPRPKAPPRDDTHVKPLLDRYLRRLTDVYPFHLATNLYGTAIYARSGDAAELERCVSTLEGATFPGWPSGEIVSRDDEPQHAACPDTAPFDAAGIIVSQIRADADMLAMVATGKMVDSLMDQTLPSLAFRMVDQCDRLQAVLSDICVRPNDAAPATATDEAEEYEGAEYAGGDYKALRGVPDGLSEAVYAEMERRFPKELAEHFGALVYTAMYRDWKAMQRELDAITGDAR